MANKLKFDDDIIGFEMPTPCDHCRTKFDLHDGVAFNNTIYCEKCGEDLNTMKELEYEIEGINDIIEDAKITIEDNIIELENKKKELSELKDIFLDRM